MTVASGEFNFQINNTIPVPRDALRVMRSQNSRARYRKAPFPGERLTLDAALYLAGGLMGVESAAG